MGIYDREYYRQGRSGFRLSPPRSAVVALVLVNVAVFVVETAELYSRPQRNVRNSQLQVVHLLAAHVDAGQPASDTLARPWMWWQLLTYGFVHDIALSHILFNMLTLFILGRDVEDFYGTREFIRIYLLAITFSGLVWALVNRLLGGHGPSMLFGASGAVAAVVVLYALNFPKRTLAFMFVLPLPAWLLGVLMIGLDILGAMGQSQQEPGVQKIAYSAHLAGAAFAAAYFYFRWNFGGWFGAAGAWLKRRSRPSLRVFRPEDDREGPVADEEVDRILTKIHREGEASLTRQERRILETASKEYRRRRQTTE